MFQHISISAPPPTGRFFPQSTHAAAYGSTELAHAL